MNYFRKIIGEKSNSGMINDPCYVLASSYLYLYFTFIYTFNRFNWYVSDNLHTFHYQNYTDMKLSMTIQGTNK